MVHQISWVNPISMINAVPKIGNKWKGTGIHPSIVSSTVDQWWTQIWKRHLVTQSPDGQRTETERSSTVGRLVFGNLSTPCVSELVVPSIVWDSIAEMLVEIWQTLVLHCNSHDWNAVSLFGASVLWFISGLSPNQWIINGRLNASWKICSLVVNRQSFLVIDGYRLNLF